MRNPAALEQMNWLLIVYVNLTASFTHLRVFWLKTGTAVVEFCGVQARIDFTGKMMMKYV